MSSGLDFQWVSWLLIIIGWWFVNWTNNKSETRKELKAATEAFRVKIENLTDLAIDYHTNTRDIHKEWKIKHRLKYLWGDADHQFSSIVDKAQLTSKVFAYRKNITVSNFDTRKHKPLNINDDILDNIADSSEALIRLIEQAYIKHYLQ